MPTIHCQITERGWQCNLLDVVVILQDAAALGIDITFTALLAAPPLEEPEASAIGATAAAQPALTDRAADAELETFASEVTRHANASFEKCFTGLKPNSF